MRAPLLGDELVTLECYTWPGITADGQRNPIRRLDDFRALPRPGLRQLGLGVYCSLGRWIEPNNHVLNSTLMNFSLALGQRDEVWARLPALLGGLSAALLLLWLTGRSIGLVYAAPLVFLFALAHPYMIYFSAQARGYTWVVALQAGMMISAYATARRPGSLLPGFAAAALAIISIMNVVSMSLDWVVPFYAALLLSPPPGEGMLVKGPSHVLRRSVTIQVAAIGAVGFVFLMDRLPFVFASVSQYGLPFSGWQGFVERAGETWAYLFPGWVWSAWAAAGFAGLLLLLRSERGRFVAVAGLLTWGVTLAHFILTRKFAYPRTCGHLLPFLMIGAGALAETLVLAIRRERWRPVGWAVAAAASVALFAAPVDLMEDRDSFEQIYRMVSVEPPAAGGARTRQLIGGAVVNGVNHAAPRDWITDGEAMPANEPVRLCVWVRQRRAPTFPLRARDAGQRVWLPLDWSAQPGGQRLGTYRYSFITGRTTAYTGRLGDADRVMVFWYPDARRLPDASSEVLDPLEAGGGRFTYEIKRTQVKMNLIGQIYCVTFVAESPAQRAALDAVLAKAIHMYGGDAVCFTPDSPRDAEALLEAKADQRR